MSAGCMSEFPEGMYICLLVFMSEFPEGMYICLLVVCQSFLRECIYLHWLYVSPMCSLIIHPNELQHILQLLFCNRMEFSFSSLGSSG